MLQDFEELKAVADAMAGYEKRCEEILLLLGEKRTLSPVDRADVEHLYRALKEELKAVAKQGTISGARRSQTDAENHFFQHAVNAAHLALRPATNSHPISSDWHDAVSNAKLEFSNLQFSLAKLLPAD